MNGKVRVKERDRFIDNFNFCFYKQNYEQLFHKPFLDENDYKLGPQFDDPLPGDSLGPSR